MRTWLLWLVGMLAGFWLTFCSGCDLLDRLLPPEPEPECPYSQWICDLIDDLPEQAECVEGCFGD